MRSKEEIEKLLKAKGLSKKQIDNILGNRAYWSERFEALEVAQVNTGLEYYEEVDKQFKKAMYAMQCDIEKWYARFADSEGITLLEAKKRLNAKELEEFHWTVEEYIEKGKTLKYSNEWAQELENASCRVHISRLEALKLQLQQHVEVLYGGQADGLGTVLSDIYEYGFNHTCFEVAKGTGLAVNINRINERKLKAIISKPWASDGLNFSERIWGKYRPDLVEFLHTELTQSCIRGENPKKLIQKLQKKTGNKAKECGNLIMTETAYFSSLATKGGYDEIGVEEYEILATLDSKTSDLCRALDGKPFKMTEYEPWVTAPPFHNRCRSTTIPHFDDEIAERVARDNDGKIYTVPGDIKYHEWEKKFIDINKELEKLQKLKPPNKRRHLLTSLGKNSKAKSTNTIIMPDVDYMADIESIQKGLYNKVNGMYVVGNRTYTYHDSTFYPVSGDGFITLNRGEYGWIIKIKTDKDNPNLKNILYRMGAKDDDIERMKDILRKGGIL